MKLGVLTVPLYGMPLEDALQYLSGLGVQMVELGAGGFPGNTHTLPYLNGEKSIDELKSLLAKYNLGVSAISAHGNAIHPTKKPPPVFRRISKTPSSLRKSSVSTR